MTQVLGMLPPVSETQIVFLAPGFDLTQPWLLQSFDGSPTWVSGTQTLEPAIICCFPGALLESSVRSKVARTSNGILIGDVGIQSAWLSWCATPSAALNCFCDKTLKFTSLSVFKYSTHYF